MSPNDKLMGDEEEIKFQRAPIITIPDANCPKWIKNAKGEVIGYENVREITLEEFKALYV